MNDEHPAKSPASTPDTRSWEQRLARRPHVLARFRASADLIDAALADGCTADEAEGRAIEELRQLGQELLADWAAEKQTRSLVAARTEHPRAIKHNKKSNLADRLRQSFGARTVAAPPARRGGTPSVLSECGRPASGPFRPVATRAHGLWSGHRHLIQQRLKLAGSWWKETHAQAMLALRTARANNLWNSYWSSN